MKVKNHKDYAMKVRNFRDYALFDYTSEGTDTFELGDILIKEGKDNTEIGVVIQTFTDGTVRTDMYGNESNHRLATIEEIKEFRPEILGDILIKTIIL
jgi:hypothetical protein